MLISFVLLIQDSKRWKSEKYKQIIRVKKNFKMRRKEKMTGEEKKKKK